MKVGVLPFKDGTEDYVKKGKSFPVDLTYNLARTSRADMFPQLEPAIVGKYFADELESSGAFESVEFLLGGEGKEKKDVFVGGTIKIAEFYVRAPILGSKVQLRATFEFEASDRRGENFWRQTVRRPWIDWSVLHRQKKSAGEKKVSSYLLRGMYKEALGGLLSALEDRGGSGARISPGLAGDPATDELIREILKD